jgi:hypothetical protein
MMQTIPAGAFLGNPTGGSAIPNYFYLGTSLQETGSGPYYVNVNPLGNPLFGPTQMFTAQGGIVALAGGGAGGTALTSVLNNVSVSTDGDSVVMPPVQVGETIWVCDAVTRQLAVFANGTDQIDGASSIRMSGNTCNTFTGYATGRWGVTQNLLGTSGDIVTFGVHGAPQDAGFGFPLSSANGGLGAASLTGYLYANGSGAATASTTIPTSVLSGSVAVANGGTGTTTSTGTGNAVLSISPTLTTPALGTPSSVTLTNATGLPISTGVSGLGSGVATGLGSAATGTGGPVLSTSPSITTPTMTTPVVSTATASTNACFNSSKAVVSCTPVWADVTNGALTGTVSTTNVMAGLGVTITPATTGRVAVNFTGSFSMTGAVVTCSFQFAWGLVSGGVPTNGAAATGTLVGKVQTIKPAAVSNNANLAIGANITGLTPGTAYWIDLQFATGNASDTCAIGPSNTQANEG